MSTLYTRLRVRKVMLQPEIEKEPEPEPEPEPEIEPVKNYTWQYVFIAIAGLILSKLKTHMS